jgi:Protein of unknown function (DUF1217)
MDLLTTNIGVADSLSGWQVLSSKQPSDFSAFINDPVLKREIAYFKENAPKATTASALLADPRLQDFALTAFGLSSENGMTALMEKVLNSDPNDSKSFAVKMADTHYQAIAKAFNYGGSIVPGQAAITSSAEAMLNTGPTSSTMDFQSFSGKFGGITLSNVDLSGANSPQSIASTLQAAFQRADGNRSDITVTALGPMLTFKDASGRGTAVAFNWQSAANGSNADQPTNLVTGSPAVAQQGGPNVTKPAFIDQMVQLYTQAQFQKVVGGTSDILRQALYAKQNLLGIKNWYSVMADTKLASVVYAALNLPSTFGKLDVDQQNKILISKMDIKDFQDPTKLNQFLNKFVAISESQNSNAANQSPAVQLLTAFTSGPQVINLTLPTQISSATLAAMLSSGGG